MRQGKVGWVVYRLDHTKQQEFLQIFRKLRLLLLHVSCKKNIMVLSLFDKIILFS